MTRIAYIKLSQLKPHPKNVKIYGANEDVSELQASIEQFGLVKNIVVTQDYVIVSGHSRWQAVKNLGWDVVRCEVEKFKKETDVITRMLLENAYRQKTNVQKTQEYAVRLEVDQMIAKEKQAAAGSEGKEFGIQGGRGNKKPLGENFPQGGSEEPTEEKKRAPRARDEAANKSGLGSGRRAEDALKALKKSEELREQGEDAKADLMLAAINKSKSTAKELIGVVDELSDDDATDFSKKLTEGKTQVLGIVKTVNKKKQIKQAKAEYIKSTVENKQPIVTIADCKDYLSALEDNSIDLLFTDPPYMTDVEDIADFAKSWLPLALQKVKPTGRAFICIGAYPKEVQAYFNILLDQPKFILDNPLIWTYRNTLGVTPKNKYNLNYQMVLHLYSESSPELDTSVTKEMFSVQDINAPDGRQGNRLHTWQKPDELARRIVRHSTKEGDLVVDCFACTGTFLLAASSMGRRAKGCEINVDNAAIAKQRGCDVQA